MSGASLESAKGANSGGGVCTSCGKTIARGAARFVQPSEAYGFRNLPLERRLVCARCTLDSMAYSRRISGLPKRPQRYKYLNRLTVVR